jgi:exo-1,4-beta-D-glucosaminidase
MQKANVSITAGANATNIISIRNTSPVPAVFIRLHLVDASGNDVLPVRWSENYLTLWPGEKLDVAISYDAGSYAGAQVVANGMNVAE